jgi:hypothetical protein
MDFPNQIMALCEVLDVKRRFQISKIGHNLWMMFKNGQFFKLFSGWIRRPPDFVEVAEVVGSLDLKTNEN